MNIHTEQFLINGDAGNLECAVNYPDQEMFPSFAGLALVAHPHPLFGGTMENKVAQTLARTFVSLGYVTVRMNFRGVGKSEGVHDAGIGETDDMETLLHFMRQRYPDLPLVLSGFSFGTFVQSRLHQRLSDAGISVQRLVLVGAAAGKWAMPDIPTDTILIHGELDDTIPLQAVFEWLRPQDIPVMVIPGADHFFHRRLPHIKKIISDLWH
ncbi:alpha/beta hydrolase [Undibacterium fentianense]|uniref:Alpha/beta fold hydrolase n=1 Tax=Undibacterium fentianense TaxID=2828728 RepID=A0A941E671_9BURK|nr:alpha/beta fold hydrolase [Undibacterium fentianense]MBR7801701.1 alpha/beta fold hydrolase [Undibacterium fentianense]